MLPSVHRLCMRAAVATEVTRVVYQLARRWVLQAAQAVQVEMPLSMASQH